MMAQAAASDPAGETAVLLPILGATALLATLAAMIALARLLQAPMERMEGMVRTLSAEVARGGEPVPGLGLPLACSGDLMASARALQRLRQVLVDRHRRAEEGKRTASRFG